MNLNPFFPLFPFLSLGSFTLSTPDLFRLPVAALFYTSFLSFSFFQNDTFISGPSVVKAAIFPGKIDSCLFLLKFAETLCV